MKSIRIYPDYKDIDRIKKLYDSSFPRNERIPFKMLLMRMKDNNPMFAYYEDEYLIGMSFCFMNDDIVYLSYLCVDEKYRNRGYGTKILKTLQEELSSFRIAIDIEEVKEDCDNYEERKKRKDFYLKNGFVSADFHYHIYHVDYEILCYGGMITKEDWKKVTRKSFGPFADTAKFR